MYLCLQISYHFVLIVRLTRHLNTLLNKTNVTQSLLVNFINMTTALSQKILLCNRIGHADPCEYNLGLISSVIPMKTSVQQIHSFYPFSGWEAGEGTREKEK